MKLNTVPVTEFKKHGKKLQQNCEKADKVWHTYNLRKPSFTKQENIPFTNISLSLLN